jgi:hypothetical protein
VSIALFVFAEHTSARAQEPPLFIPAGGPPLADPIAVPFNSWLLYPSLNSFTQYSNNYFLTGLPTPAQPKISGWSFGVSPAITAEWSNGIHTTTVYGTYTHTEYPTQNEAITDDGEATFTQRYAPLRDLNFTFIGDYTHKTINSSLTPAIPSPVTTTGTSVLPNGTTVLPSGLIVSPSGQVLGQVAPGLSTTALSQQQLQQQLLINPSNSLSATGKVQKMFADGIVTLSASLLDQNYQERTQQPSLNFTAKTFTEDTAFWLGPLFYAYSSGSYSTRSNVAPPPTFTAYRIVGGIGTRQFGLFRASAYFGNQGSQSSGQPSAGGNVFGSTFSYYPTPLWTITANIDVTINIAGTPSSTSPNTITLNIPVLSPLSVPVTESTQTTTTTLRSYYRISPLWTLTGTAGYARVQFLGSTGSLTGASCLTNCFENAWIADALLRYEVRRNLELTWEYQYASIVSNMISTTAIRNFVAMSASYKF